MVSRILPALLLIACTMASAQNVRIEPLDNNTSKDDFAPAYTNHGRVIVFTSDEGGDGQRLRTMERTSGGWTSATELLGDVNDATHSGSGTLTPDGQTVIFASYENDVDGRGRTDLYSARKVNGKWIEVTNLGSSINSDFYDAHPSITSDGRTLYFVSDRPGGNGETDIYVATWGGSSWSAAKPLAGINTAKSEMSPVIASDGKTIYFSSDRAGGAGGFDIYVAKISGSAVTDIRRLADPVNTAADEMFYSALPNSDQALLSRTTSNGDYDNYTVTPNPFPSEPVTLVEGIVSDATSKVALGSTITVTDLATGKKIASLRSDDQSGQYYVTLTPGRIYSITASAPGYVFHTERYEVPPGAKGATVKKDIDLSPLSKGGDRLLVFFDYDKSELKSESTPELERVIELLRENPNIRLRFDGHTDDQGSDEYNDGLSLRRAQSVLDYVVAGGVPTTRLEAKGFGKRQPAVQGATDEARAANRRVEMKVVE
ncbi:MAG TPA: OmpA family protein [Candidatus Didemnitutus sp.]|nr:OmpA family protein [Candidatus Didemnitutus sp.]